MTSDNKKAAASLAWKSLGAALLLVVFAGALYPLYPSLLLAVGLVYPGFFCDTESRGSLTDVAGYDFQFSETACDVVAKDDAITVFISKTGESARTPIFKYDPGADALPTITAIDRRTVQVSLERVSSVFFRRYAYGDLAISYDIRRID
jgi:hypothetical protein